jgi:hypothetical protein
MQSLIISASAKHELGARCFERSSIVWSIDQKT